jgi:hypothetical protein
VVVVGQLVNPVAVIAYNVPPGFVVTDPVTTHVFPGEVTLSLIANVPNGYSSEYAIELFAQFVIWYHTDNAVVVVVVVGSGANVVVVVVVGVAVVVVLVVLVLVVLVLVVLVVLVLVLVLVVVVLVLLDVVVVVVGHCSTAVPSIVQSIQAVPTNVQSIHRSTAVPASLQSIVVDVVVVVVQLGISEKVIASRSHPPFNPE